MTPQSGHGSRPMCRASLIRVTSWCLCPQKSGRKRSLDSCRQLDSSAALSGSLSPSNEHPCYRHWDIHVTPLGK